MVAIIPVTQQQNIITKLREMDNNHKINLYTTSYKLAYDCGLHLGQLYSDCNCIELFVYNDEQEHKKILKDLKNKKFTFIELQDEYINTYSYGKKEASSYIILEDIAYGFIKVLYEYFEEQNQKYKLLWALSLETDEPTIRTNNIISVLSLKDEDDIVIKVDDTSNYQLDLTTLLTLVQKYF